MGEIIYGDIKQYIDELAQSLGVAADHVYGLLVRQQIVDGIVTITAFLLVWLIFGVILVMSNRKSETDEFGDINGYAVVSLVSGVILLLAIIFGLVESFDAVKQLINPEYYAIREIMDVFKGGE